MLPTHGLSSKPLKVKLLAGEQIATENSNAEAAVFLGYVGNPIWLGVAFHLFVPFFNDLR